MSGNAAQMDAARQMMDGLALRQSPPTREVVLARARSNEESARKRMRGFATMAANLQRRGDARAARSRSVQALEEAALWRRLGALLAVRERQCGGAA